MSLRLKLMNDLSKAKNKTWKTNRPSKRTRLLHVKLSQIDCLRLLEICPKKKKSTVLKLLKLMPSTTNALSKLNWKIISSLNFKRKMLSKSIALNSNKICTKMCVLIVTYVPSSFLKLKKKLLSLRCNLNVWLSRLISLRMRFKLKSNKSSKKITKKPNSRKKMKSWLNRLSLLVTRLVALMPWLGLRIMISRDLSMLLVRLRARS